MIATSVERKKTSAVGDVPEIIRAAGERAVNAYREFLDDPKRRPGTNKLYRVRAGRFFRWAKGRGMTLETIAASEIAAYHLGTKVSHGIDWRSS
jgi:hypothetical protein